MKTDRFVLLLSENENAALQALAEKSNVSKAEVVRRLLGWAARQAGLGHLVADFTLPAPEPPKHVQ